MIASLKKISDHHPMVRLCTTVAIGIGLLICVPTRADDDATASPRPAVATDTEPTDISESELPACCAVDAEGKTANGTPNADQSILTESPIDTPNPTPPARASQWIVSKDRQPFDLEFKMTDQDNQTLLLSELKGKPLAVSFIFTRCPNIKMCPLITLTMAHLQRDLKLAGLAQKVTLALLTYDPVYDTPQRLRQYGIEQGLEFTNAVMLRPDADEFRQLLGEFQIGVNYQSDGSIGHAIELLVIDQEGRFVRDYQGQIWDNAAVLQDLRNLVVEQEMASSGG